MRSLFGLIGLLVALALTAILVRQQMKVVQIPIATPASGTVVQQSQQVQQQIKQAVEGAMQARPMPDDQ